MLVQRHKGTSQIQGGDNAMCNLRMIYLTRHISTIDNNYNANKVIIVYVRKTVPATVNTCTYLYCYTLFKYVYLISSKYQFILN